MLWVYRRKTAKRYEWQMHFHDKMPENGGRNIFSDKQTTDKVSLMFFDVKILTERYQISFFDSVKKQAT